LQAIQDFGIACALLDYLENKSKTMKFYLDVHKSKDDYSSNITSNYVMRVMGYDSEDIHDLFHGFSEYRPVYYTDLVESYEKNKDMSDYTRLQNFCKLADELIILDNFDEYENMS
jgi:hypothetical protein